MIIKKYIANTVEEAMDLLRQELGPDAVVLTTRHIQRKGLLSWFSPGKVEVTAAVEESELRAFTERKEKKTTAVKTETTKAPPRLAVKQKEDDLSHNLSDLKKSLQTARTPQVNTYGDPRLRRPKTKGTGDQISLSADAQRIHSETQKHDEDAEKEGMEFAAGILRMSQGLIHEFADEVDEAPRKTRPAPAMEIKEQPKEDLRSIIREEMMRAQQSVSVGSLTSNDEDTVGSVRFLMGKGIARSIALDIETTLDKRLGKTDLSKPTPARKERLQNMKNELQKLVQTTGPLTLQSGRPTVVAIVGPTGVGKTTTLAKIAAQYSQELGKKVGVITLDTEKVGAREQIKSLTDSLRLPLITARSGSELQQAVTAMSDRQLILVDTAGCSQYRSHRLDSLVELLSAVPEMQTCLTLSATTKDVDALGAVRLFSRMPIDSLIFTKLDETIAHGLIVNLCKKTGLPIRYLTTGTEIPGDIKIAEAGDIARNLLVQHNSREFDAIRRQVSA